MSEDPTTAHRRPGDFRIGDHRRLRWLGVWLPAAGVGLLIVLMALVIRLGCPRPLMAHLAAIVIAAGGAYVFSRFVFRIVERKEREILRRNRELAAMNAVAAVVNESLDLNEVLNRSLESVLEVTGADAGEIFLWDDEHESMTQRAFRGQFREAFEEITRFRRNEGLPGRIAQSRAPIVIHDLHRDERFLRKKVTQVGFQSFAGVPLSAKGKVAGVMGIAYLETGRLSTEDVKLLGVLGSQIGIAIENATLYSRLREMAMLEERHRIAREMHDGLAQDLGYVHLKLSELLEATSPSPAASVRDELAGLRKVIGGAYEDVRQAIFGLKVMVSRGLGLVPTLAEYLHDFGEQADLEVKLTIAEELATRLSPQAEVQLIRIIQEALTNVRKHARARRAWVGFEANGDSVEVVIRDDGRGFDTGAAHRSGKDSFGMQTMRERAESVKGTLEVDSRPEEGTRVIVRLPMEDREVASWTP